MPKSSTARCRPRLRSSRSATVAAFTSAHQRRLGDLQPQRVGGDAALGERLGDHARGTPASTSWRLPTLTDDGDVRRTAAGCRHRPSWASESRSIGAPSSPISPVSSAIGRNWSGPSRPRSGCSQRASTSKPMTWPVVELDDRLVVRHDLAALEAAAQLVGGAQGQHRRLVRAGRERLDAVAAACLGPVHRRVGVAQQLGRSTPRRGRRRRCRCSR